MTFRTIIEVEVEVECSASAPRPGSRDRYGAPEEPGDPSELTLGTVTVVSPCAYALELDLDAMPAERERLLALAKNHSNDL